MKKKIIILSIIVIVIILIIGGYVIVNKQRHDNDLKISNKNTIEEIANLKEPDENISNNIEYNKPYSNLEDIVDNSQGKSNTINTSETNINNNNTNSSSVSYIILELEDIEAEERKQQGLEYKNKKITNKQKIDSLMKIIDSATSYTEKNFIADFGDCPPCAKIYLSNGEIYTVAAGDQINDNGETVNLMTKWYSEDESDKTLYKVNTKLGEYIEELFND